MMKFGEWPFTRTSVAPFDRSAQLAAAGPGWRAEPGSSQVAPCGWQLVLLLQPVPIGREMRKLLRFKIFNQIDADGSGNLSFDELVQCVETLAKLP